MTFNTLIAGGGVINRVLTLQGSVHVPYSYLDLLGTGFAGKVSRPCAPKPHAADVLCVYIRTHAHTYAFACTYVCVYLYTYIYIYIHTHMYMYVCTHVYATICVHAHHASIYSPLSSYMYCCRHFRVYFDMLIVMEFSLKVSQGPLTTETRRNRSRNLLKSQIYSFK